MRWPNVLSKRRVYGVALVVSFLVSVAMAQVSTGGVDGFVADANGAGIAGAGLHLEAKAGAAFDVLADESGGFLFGGVPTGRYLLSVAAPGFRTSYRVLEVLSASTLRLGELRLEVGLAIEGACNDSGALAPEVAKVGFVREARRGGLSGSVADDQGTVGKATVTLLLRDGRVAARTLSGTDGTYLFRDVRPGRYRLRIEEPRLHLRVESLDFEVVDGVDLLFSEARMERKRRVKRRGELCL